MSNEFDNDPFARPTQDDLANHINAEVEKEDEIDIENLPETSDETTESEGFTLDLPEKDEETSKAKKRGFLTEDEYKAKFGNLDGYKSPKQFNQYGEAWGEVSDVIKGLQKQVSESQKQTEALVKYQQRTEERAYARARQELENQLQQAKNEGDVSGVEQLTREKAKLEFNENQANYQKHEEQRLSVEHQFRDRNKHWFGVNQEMTQRAATLDAKIRAEAQQMNVPLTYESLAKQIEAHLKAEYPEQMITGSKSVPNISASTSAANKSAGNAGDSIDKMFNTLDTDQKAVFAAVKKIYEKTSGGKTYTKKDFILKLKKDGEI